MGDSVHDISRLDEAITTDGGVLAELSRTVVRLHKECFGKGPTKARSYWDEDVIVCVLADGFTAAEKTLIATGAGRLVREHRSAVHDAVKERFRAAVESVVGRPVIAVMGATDEDAQTCSETFVLEALGPRLISPDVSEFASPDGHKPR